MAMSAETSKQIRANLKAAGLGARDVSVRNHSYSMGSSVRVQIRRAEVSLDLVSRIAMQSEQVSRDGSGEILSGGNTFVHVGYEPGALDAHTARAQAALDAGRTVFGDFSLSDDGRNVHLWRSDAAGTGTHLLCLVRAEAAKGLARTLATLGQLALLDAVAAEPEPSNYDPTPECRCGECSPGDYTCISQD